MNERRGLGFFGSLAAFLGMVVLSAVLMLASIDAGWWEEVSAEGGVAQIFADLTTDDENVPDSQPDTSDDAAGDSQSDASADKAEEESTEEPEPIDLSGFYYYDQLDERDQQKYESVYRALGLREESTFPGTNNDDITRFHNYVWADHPEIFYTEGLHCSTDKSKGVITLTDNTYYSDAQIEQYRTQVDAVVKEIEAGIPAGADDYAKAKHVFDYLIANVSYDHSIADPDTRASMPPDHQGQTVVNALIEHSCVCNGYAQSFQLVMKDLGIPCVLVEGELSDGRGSHAWNLVQLDGEWYYVDVTWGDPDAAEDYVPGESLEATKYAYLGMTTADMAISRGFSEWQILPDCTATADNYYVREGRVLQAMDADQINAWANASLSNGTNMFDFRCADQQVFDEVTWSLQNDFYFGDGMAYTYWADDKTRTFFIRLG